MISCKQALMGGVLFFATALTAQAQWSVAFQDRSKQDLNVIHFVDSRLGWVVGDKGVVNVTQDAGGEWLPHNSRIEGNINDIFFLNREVGWMIASGGRIFRTQNGGGIWDPVYKSGAADLYSITFARDRKSVV